MTTQKNGIMHVYKLDTGNHHPSTPPPTTTTTTKIIARSLGALLRRSKTYRENNHNHKPTKKDTKEVVLETSRPSPPAIIDGGRIPVPAIKDGRKSASVIEEGKKPGIEVRVVGGRRSAENRAEMVMINVGEVAELFQVRVLVTDMQVHASSCIPVCQKNFG